MFIDKELLLSDAQNLAQAAGNYLSTNAIDLGASVASPLGPTPIGDVGRGSPVELFAQVVTAFTSGGAGTLQVQLVQADDAALGTNMEVLAETTAIALATLIAGYQFRIGFVSAGVTRRFIGLRYVIGTAAMTAGNVTAGLVIDKQQTYV